MVENKSLVRNIRRNIERIASRTLDLQHHRTMNLLKISARMSPIVDRSIHQQYGRWITGYGISKDNCLAYPLTKRTANLLGLSIGLKT